MNAHPQVIIALSSVFRPDQSSFQISILNSSLSLIGYFARKLYQVYWSTELFSILGPSYLLFFHPCQLKISVYDNN